MTHLTQRRPEDRVPVRLLQAISLVFARLYHRVILRSPCRLPGAGPAILVCNHTSAADPVLIQSVCPRLISWMMAAEYYNLPVLNWVFRTVGIIPTTRSGRDLAAVRSALRALQDGRILGIFPEGRIAPTPDLLPFETGVALMALRANVPVYPVYLGSAQRGRPMLQAYLRRSTVSIRFGKPVCLDYNDTTKEALQAATDKIQQAVAALAVVERKRQVPGSAPQILLEKAGG